VQLGELGVEMQGGHRLISFQVESQVLNGVDASADAIAQFAHVLFAAVDGRPAPRPSGARSARPKATAPRTAATKPSGAGAGVAKPKPAKPPAPKPVLRLSAPKGT
jgi:hypothetical protein